MGMLEIASWRRERRAFGRVRYTPPEDASLGEIVIHERVRPLTPLRQLSQARGAADDALGPATRFATDEGELGALVRFETGGTHHVLGVIYGDDFQTIVDGQTTRADQRERIHVATRELVVHLPLGLGHQRFRRFWYEPPPGWQGLVRGLVTDWFPLDHPRNPASIKVLPARPPDATFQLDTLFHDDSFADVAPDAIARTEVTLGAFKGTLGSASVAGRAFLTAVLEDRQYVYVLRLSTAAERLADDEAVFQDVLRSCAPLPQARGERSSMLAARALDYWIG